MNQKLLSKFLQKISLQELYNEIKDNDKLISDLGRNLCTNHNKIFVQMVNNFIISIINNSDNKTTDLLKNLILNLDSVNDSANTVIKKKVESENKSDSDSYCNSGLLLRRGGC